MSEENVQTVKVTRIDIPFMDVFWLTLKAIFASILAGFVIALPFGFLFLVSSLILTS